MSNSYPSSSVRSHRGMVAAGEPLSALAGLEMLMKGGNAVDAALAVAGVNLVTMPEACGLGGDAFMLVKTGGEIWDIRGSGSAPLAASPDHFLSQGLDALPLEGVLSVAVPGAPAAYQEAWMRWGTMDWQALLEPAIFYAQEGFPVSDRLSGNLCRHQAKLNAEARRALLPGDRAPRPGQILPQPDLAVALERLAVDGSAPFYSGDVAEKYVSFMRERDGLMEEEDLQAHKTQVARPLKAAYRESTVYQTGPPSQGFIMLEALAILSGWSLGDMDPAEATHVMVEAAKLAYRDRLERAGDPAVTKFRAEDLLAEDHIESRRALIEPDKARPWPPGRGAGGDTTSFVVVDAAGNAVSFIHSLSHAFGSGVMVPGTGILLNNRLGRGFTLEEGHPNRLEPGKRTMHTLNAYMVIAPGGRMVVGNTPGGDGQPQWNLQVLSAVLDRALGAQEAVSSPRWTIFPGTDPARMAELAQLRLEAGIPAGVARYLEARGHPVAWIDAWSGGGSAQLVITDGHALEGGSDPRGGGLVLGF